MKHPFITAIAVSAMAIMSCSTDTDTLGSSLTNESDKLDVSTGLYQAYTRSVLADSVFARNFEIYFGQVKDPETGAHVKTEFMAQFNIQEGLKLPDKDKILSKDDDGLIVADSCEIWMLFDKTASYGDSLASLKMNIYELDRPMSETKTYYSNYDPREEGFIRKDGLKENLLFSLSNLTYSDSIRKLTGYADMARLSFSEEYTDKDGVTYNNYGSYLLRKYYDHPEYFKNSYAFTNYVCPGFFFEVADGIGLMAKFGMIEMRIYYHYQSQNNTYTSFLATSSTSEVLQTIQVTNEKDALTRLVEDNSCTYLKAPAGIYTEVTLPVDEIFQEHAADSLLSVNMTFQRQNSGVKESRYLFNAPSNIIMIPKDSLHTFFEEEKTYDFKSAFMATLAGTNSYTFSNISNLITLLSENKQKGLASDPNWVEKHPNWNKVLLIPISVTYTDANKTESVIDNQIGLVSTKLVGGQETPIDVKVIYARFKKR